MNPQGLFRFFKREQSASATATVEEAVANDLPPASSALHAVGAPRETAQPGSAVTSRQLQNSTPLVALPQGQAGKSDPSQRNPRHAAGARDEVPGDQLAGSRSPRRGGQPTDVVGYAQAPAPGALRSSVTRSLRGWIDFQELTLADVADPEMALQMGSAFTTVYSGLGLEPRNASPYPRLNLWASGLASYIAARRGDPLEEGAKLYAIAHRRVRDGPLGSISSIVTGPMQIRLHSVTKRVGDGTAECFTQYTAAAPTGTL